MADRLGKCYYCKRSVTSEDKYGAFSKRWDKKQNRYILSDFWHGDCYYYDMRRNIDIMRGINRPEYEQLSLF